MGHGCRAPVVGEYKGFLGNTSLPLSYQFCSPPGPFMLPGGLEGLGGRKRGAVRSIYTTCRQQKRMERGLRLCTPLWEARLE